MYCKAKQLIPKPAASTFLWNCGWFRKIEGRDFDKILWRDISRLLLHRMRAAHPAREACTSPIVCLKTWLCLLCLSLLCLATYRLVCSTYNPFLCSALLCTALLCTVLLCTALLNSCNSALMTFPVLLHSSLLCSYIFTKQNSPSFSLLPMTKALVPRDEGWMKKVLKLTKQSGPFWAS